MSQPKEKYMYVAILVTGVYCAATAWYCHLIADGKLPTVLATWVMFMITVVAGFVSYMRSSGERHWATNVCNTVDVIATVVVVLFLLTCGNTEIRRFDEICIGIWALIMMLWFFTGRLKVANADKVANIAFNLLLIIAYVPLVQHLATATVNTEPYVTWSATFLASSIGMLNPIKKRDWLALLYATRAVLSTSTVLVLMARVDGYL
jgi:hypothetical protein